MVPDRLVRATDAFVAMGERLTGVRLPALEMLREGSNLVFADAVAGRVLRAQVPSHETQIHENIELVEALVRLGAPLLGPSDPPVASTAHVVITQWPLADPPEADVEGPL